MDKNLPLLHAAAKLTLTQEVPRLHLRPLCDNRALLVSPEAAREG